MAYSLPRGDAADAPDRTQTAYHPMNTFVLDKDRQYQQQFADMYFLRLAKIKPAVKKIAEEAWKDTVIGGEEAKHMDRVLDVRQGELCWVAGTVYMDMPLKPDVLEDVTKDVSLQNNIYRSWGEPKAPRTDSHPALDLCSTHPKQVFLRRRP